MLKNKDSKHLLENIKLDIMSNFGDKKLLESQAIGKRLTLGKIAKFK